MFLNLKAKDFKLNVLLKKSKEIFRADFMIKNNKDSKIIF